MKENREKFKQFVIKELKDYEEYREASTEGYAEIITDEAVKLFCQPAVIKSVCDDCTAYPFDERGKTPLCKTCKNNPSQTIL